MNIYNIIKYSSLALSLIGVAMVLLIFFDNLRGIDGVLVTAYIVFGFAVLLIQVRAVLTEMVNFSKNHNIIALSTCFSIPIVTYLVLIINWGFPYPTAAFQIVATIAAIFIIGLNFVTLYYLVLRKKQSLYFLVLFLTCLGIAFIFSDGLEVAMRDGKVLSALQSNFVSAALYTFYCLILIACGTMLFFGFKQRK
tara:strand:+ start:454 stop:1038 length:585 start_codon:yes stop_codon:yes gene_type:complete